jgi:hypothetical protein
METQLIISPEIQEKTESALTVIDMAKNLSIVSVDNYRLGQDLMADIKGRIKTLEEIRMGQTRPLDESKKRILDFFRIPIQKLEDAKAHLNQIMVNFTEEQERNRREEERQLQEAARKRAEEEALQQALEAEAAGDKQEAEAILQEPVYVPPIRVMSEIPKSKESHIRETWSAVIDDPMALVKAIAEGKTDIQSIEPNKLIENHPFLNTMATRYRDKLNIPGVRAVSRKTQI